jgi:hypothetical protein
MLSFKRVAAEGVNNCGCLKILNFKFQNIRTLNEFFGLYTISNEKHIKLQSCKSRKVYNFSIKFIFIQLHMKTLYFLRQLFL